MMGTGIQIEIFSRDMSCY